jgi:hypothetical protein
MGAWYYKGCHLFSINAESELEKTESLHKHVEDDSDNEVYLCSVDEI